MAGKRLEFRVHALIARDGSQYSALCLEYNVATCARTPEKALTALMDATINYLEAFLDTGQAPPQRPASEELLLEFLGLDSGREEIPAGQVAESLRSVIMAESTLTAPLVYSAKDRAFTARGPHVLPRAERASYPVLVVHHAYS